MKSQDILDLYDQEMRLNPLAGLAKVHKRPGLTLLTVPPPSPHAGWVLYTRLDAAEIDKTIQEVIDFFQPYGGSFEWKVYDHDTPTDLKERLSKHGFISEEIEGLLAMDLEKAPPSFWEPIQPIVHRVYSRDQLTEIAKIQARVWEEPFDDLVEMLATELEETPDQLSVYMAYLDGQPASCAWIRFYPQRQFAELYGGSTLISYRGRVLYRALVAARAQEACTCGVRFLAVDTSPMSRPILQKLGFSLLTYTQPFVWHVD